MGFLYAKCWLLECLFGTYITCCNGAWPFPFPIQPFQGQGWELPGSKKAEPKNPWGYKLSLCQIPGAACIGGCGDIASVCHPLTTSTHGRPLAAAAAQPLGPGCRHCLDDAGLLSAWRSKGLSWHKTLHRFGSRNTKNHRILTIGMYLGTSRINKIPPRTWILWHLSHFKGLRDINTSCLLC